MNPLDKWLAPFASSAAATIATSATYHASGSNGSESSSRNFITYRELYEERAAIIQYDAELPQGEAELIATKEVALAYMQDHLPDVLAIITQPSTGPP